MKDVRFAPLLVLALAACTPQQKPSGPDDSLREHERAIVMTVNVQETSQLKVGQWARYSARTSGSPAVYSTRLSVVAAEGGNYWIENRTNSPGSGSGLKVAVVKYQIDAAAKPLQMWYAESGANPLKIYPGKDAAGNPIQLARPPEQDSKSKVDIAKESITIHHTGKMFDCTRLTSKATYPDGRETKMTTWCSPEVPFAVVYNGNSYGGVVRRTYGEYTLELDAKGTDAVAELALPDK